MYRTVAMLIVLTLVAGTARAQNEQPQAEQPKAEQRAANVATRTNIKIDLTITDQRGGAPAERKQVSMIAADGFWGKIRSAAMTRQPDGGPAMPVTLNVDARPFMTMGGQIQVELTVLYNPPDESNKVGLVRPTELNQSMTIVLQNGKPLVISQAADPIADRKMIVEVVATILK